MAVAVPQDPPRPPEPAPAPAPGWKERRPRPEVARPASRRRGAREMLRLLHRVLGLGAGIVLIVTGLTGSTMVFRQEIDRALNPHLLVVAPAAERAPLQAVLDRVVASYPGDEAPARIRMPQQADGTYEFWLGAAPSRYVYADPYTGALLGARRPTEFLTGWLFLLHSHMLAGEVGHVVAGVAGLILVVLSISGLVVWWPRRAPWHAWRQWRQSLTIAGGSGAARATYDVHRVVGFYASALLLVAGVTGASLVFPEAFERAAFWVAASTPPAPPLPPLARPGDEAPSLPLDSLLAVAERAQPGGAISYLYLPTAPGQEFGVRKRLPGEKHPNGKSFVHVQPTTGRVLNVEDGTRAPRGGRVYSILYPLHIGILGGVATRLLAMAVGLSLPLLACTGALVWWRRGRRGRRAGDQGRQRPAGRPRA